jgi:exodeoxyribonuclease VII small subunit
MSKESPTPKPHFEDSLERLEAIISELESGKAPLERSLELFEEGMKLAEVCRHQLDAAEQRIEMLVRKGGEVSAEPFKGIKDRQP